MSCMYRHWYYRNDSDDLVPYSASHSLYIDDIFSQSIVISDTQYRFEFSRMKQVNVVTGYERDIRRINSGYTSRPGSVQWEYRNDSSVFVPYSQSDNVKIEHMFQPNLFKLCICGREYRFDFIRMKQVNVATGFERDISSIWTDDSKLLWEVGRVIYVHLVPQSSEYKHVCSKFYETLNKATQKVTIVQCVQGKCLWDRYMQARQQLSWKNAGKVNEMDLFHGTRKTPSKTICQSAEGFDVSYSRKGMWGHANYFAVNASYSHNYSHCVRTGRKMILAKVLTGDSFYCKPDSSLRSPPMKTWSQYDYSEVWYDSVTGHTKST